jgi:hypothetical protein
MAGMGTALLHLYDWEHFILNFSYCCHMKSMGYVAHEQQQMLGMLSVTE